MKAKSFVTFAASFLVDFFEDVDFILENIKTTSYSDIAAKRGITRNQVNRVRTEVVNGLKKAAEANPHKEEAIMEYIKQNLTRPDDMKVGGNKGSGQAKNAIDNVVGSILDSL